MIVFQRNHRARLGMASPSLLFAMFCGISACGDSARSQQKKQEPGNSGSESATSTTGDSTSKDPAGSKESGSADDSQESGDPGEADACENDEDRRCLAEVPAGWSGPVQPQSAATMDELADCAGEELQAGFQSGSAGPDASKNIYVAEAKAEKARCSSCSVNLDLGSCGPASLQHRFVDPDQPSKCLKFDDESPKAELGAGCERLSGEGLSAGRVALGLRPGTSNRQEATCTLGPEPKHEIDPPSFPAFYRLCAAQPDPSSCPEGESCFAFDQSQEAPREPKACIYKEGEAECPSQYAQERLVLYGGFKDERSCSACKLEHQVGEIVCEHDVGLSARDRDLRCTQPRKVKGEDLCVTEEEFLGREAPWGITERDRRTSYTGSCGATDPSPEGDLHLQLAITVCCASF